jgi:hypothetical protein
MTMKSLSVSILAAACCALSAHAGAGACRPVEYAQVKDMPTAELVAAYCRHGAARQDYVARIEELMQRAKDINWAWIGGANECKREQEKIVTALQARGAPAPTCER